MPIINNKEARQKAIEEQKRKHYKQCTDEIRILYECFIESGFTDDQAFQLANTYVRQTLFDNVLRSNIYKKVDYRDITEEQKRILRKYKEKENAGTTD